MKQLLIACVFTSAAAAQGSETNEPAGYAWAETAVFVEQDRGPRVTAISPLVGAEYWIAQLIEVRARFGWSGVRLDGDGFRNRRWRWSNLELGGSYRREIPTYYPYVFEVSIGLNLEIPTARARELDPDGAVLPEDQEILRRASAMRGRRDPWLWRPDTFSLVVPLAARLVHDQAHLKVAVDVATMFATDESDTSLIFQFLGEGGYWVERKLLLALALTVLTSPSREEATSVSGAFRSILKLDPVRFHLDIWLNLNDFRSFTIAGSRWGVVLGIGVALQ